MSREHDTCDAASTVMRRRRVRFPPPAGPVLVSTASRAAALGGIAMQGATRRPARAARAVAWWSVAVGGPRLVPGRRTTWEPLMGTTRLRAILDAVEAHAGSCDDASVAERRHAERPGTHLLTTRRGRPVAFVRAQPDRGAFEREARVIAAVRAAAPTVFDVPASVGNGVVDGWEWIALRALPVRLHRPDLRAPMGRVCAEIERCLDGLLVDSGAPAHWTPMHGDLSPWNLRRMGRRRWLFDWEEVRLAPPGADLAYFRATAAAVCGTDPGTTTDECATYWSEVVSARPVSESDRALRDALLATLERMRR